MLVLTRKVGESIVIGEQKITVKVISVEGDQVKIGIEAPKHVEIHRHEVYDSIQKENQLARTTKSIDIEALKEIGKMNKGMQMKRKE